MISDVFARLWQIKVPSRDVLKYVCIRKVEITSIEWFFRAEIHFPFLVSRPKLFGRTQIDAILLPQKFLCFLYLFFFKVCVVIPALHDVPRSSLHLLQLSRIMNHYIFIFRHNSVVVLEWLRVRVHMIEEWIESIVWELLQFHILLFQNHHLLFLYVT